MLGDVGEFIIGIIEIQIGGNTMSHTVVVYHSGYGHTRKQAEAVAKGAAGIAGASAELVEINAEGQLAEGAWDKLDAADAIVFGTPTYMGGPSWQFKRFADASSKPWYAQAWKDKIAAGFTNSATLNGDKQGTMQYLHTLSQQHGMIWVGMGMKAPNHKAATRDDLNNLGGYAGLITQTPSDASADEMVPGDLATARAFGERVKAVTERWTR
jgi:multimeric flavodoxin WrbA